MAASSHSDGAKRAGTAGAGLPPDISAEAVRAELEKVLKSPALIHSGRLCRFLAFVVDQTLNGHADQLKEYLEAVGFVMMVQLGAKPPGLDAHDRVEARIKGLVLVEDSQSNQVFLELIGVSIERLGDYEGEEPAQQIG